MSANGPWPRARERESICPLASRLPAARAVMTDFAVLSIGYRSPQEHVCPANLLSLFMILGVWGLAPMSANGLWPRARERESIRSLASWLPAARAKITDSATLSIGWSGNSRFRRPANRVSRSRPGKQSLCEHLLPGKPTASGARGNSRFRRPANRVSRSRPGKQSLCEHLLPGKPTASGACGDRRFHIPIIRV